MAQVFSCEFYEILTGHFFTENLRKTASEPLTLTIAKILQKSKENTCATVPFLIKFQS